MLILHSLSFHWLQKVAFTFSYSIVFVIQLEMDEIAIFVHQASPSLTYDHKVETENFKCPELKSPLYKHPDCVLWLSPGQEDPLCFYHPLVQKLSGVHLWQTELTQHGL